MVICPWSRDRYPPKSERPFQEDTLGAQGSTLLRGLLKEAESAGARPPWWALRGRFLLCQAEQAQTLPQGGSRGEPGLIGPDKGAGQDNPEYGTLGLITMGT